MRDLTREDALRLTHRRLVFWAGLVLLFLLALVWLIWLSLFTEAMLVPYYCCDLATKPPLGSWQRSLNDFFAAFPGRYLPTLLFFLAGGLLFWRRMKRAGDGRWYPLIFSGAYAFLLLASLVVTSLSWWLSNTLVGPRSGGLDNGYHRTWYGLLSHLLLWTFFFIAMANIHLPGDGSQSA